MHAFVWKLKLLVKFLSSSVFPPQHIICLTNSHQLYMDYSHGLGRVKYSQFKALGFGMGSVQLN